MSVLGHPETGNPKDVTQQDSTQRPQICLIGRCKDMMSKMDLMRALEIQDEVAGISLVTRSSLLASFAGKDYTNFRRVRARTPRISHGCYILVLLAKASPLPFIATRGLLKENP